MIVRRDTLIWEWYGFIIRKLMIWFLIPGFWKVLDLCKSLRILWSLSENLKECTGALICSAQEPALRINYVKLHIDKTGESPLCRMCRVEKRQYHILWVNVRCWSNRNTKRGIIIYAGIFIENYAKNMTSKERNSGTSMSQMELLRTKGTRFCGIVQSSMTPRLKLDWQILFLLIKPWTKLRS